MFSDKKSKKNRNSDVSTSENRINEGTTIIGDIQSSGFFRIDGTVEGNITSPSRVVVGKTGIIKGLLHCDNADVEGKIEGEVKVTGMLMLRASAVVNGEIETSELGIEPGAEFNANCNMKGSVKVLQQDNEEQRSNKEKQKRA